MVKKKKIWNRIRKRNKLRIHKTPFQPQDIVPREHERCLRWIENELWWKVRDKNQSNVANRFWWMLNHFECNKTADGVFSVINSTLKREGKHIKSDSFDSNVVSCPASWQEKKIQLNKKEWIDTKTLNVQIYSLKEWIFRRKRQILEQTNSINCASWLVNM